MSTEQDTLDELKARFAEHLEAEQAGVESEADLLAIERSVSAEHAEGLAAAYAAFAGRQASNEAPAGETFIDADVVVSSEEPPEAAPEVLA
jgi:hypothetical protein